MSMARIYHNLHIRSRMPGDIVVSAWENAEHGVTIVAIETATIETAADDYGRGRRSRVVISLRASDYPAIVPVDDTITWFAQMVCEALAVAMTGEGSETP